MTPKQARQTVDIIVELHCIFNAVTDSTQSVADWLCRPNRHLDDIEPYVLMKEGRYAEINKLIGLPARSVDSKDPKEIS